MKRTIIGSVFMVLGTMISLSIIIVATLSFQNTQNWRGSRLLYTIFSTDLGLGQETGLPFIIGIILFLFGLIILLTELFRKPANSMNHVG